MRKNKKKIFIDQDKLWNMLELRYAGWSTEGLALFFNCTRRAVDIQCKKHGIEPQNVYSVKRLIKGVLPKGIWRIVDGERVLVSISYKDYKK